MIRVVQEVLPEVCLKWLEEDADMKLKCNICLEKYGVAIRTDQLVLIRHKNRDYLACIKCGKLYGGKRSGNNKPK